MKKMKRGKYLPLELLLLLSVAATFIISYQYGIEPSTVFIVAIGGGICYFSDRVFIRPSVAFNKQRYQHWLIAAYTILLSFAVIAIYTVPGPNAPSWLPQLEVGILSAAASSVLSLLFWFLASRQQTREEYLFHKEWTREEEEMKKDTTKSFPVGFGPL